MFNRNRIAFVTLWMALAFAPQSLAMKDNSCDLNLTAANANKSDSQAESNKHLKEQIEKVLKDKLPKEFEGECDGKSEDAWYEFMRGLASIESGGECGGECGDQSGSIGANGGSCGIFQMTKGDRCGGAFKLDDPYDGKKNIECAVNEWKKQLDEGKGIIGNTYWGPCKRNEPQCQEVIDIVKRKVCNGGGGDSAIDWFSERGKKSGGGGGGGGGGAR